MTDINIGAITEAINNKADRDAGNLTAEGKHNVNTLSFPSDRYKDLTLLATGSPYTAPANGIVTLSKDANAVSQLIRLENRTCKFETICYSPSSNTILRDYIEVKKGDIFVVAYNAAGQTNYFRFIYAEGEV